MLEGFLFCFQYWINSICAVAGEYPATVKFNPDNFLENKESSTLMTATLLLITTESLIVENLDVPPLILKDKGSNEEVNSMLALSTTGAPLSTYLKFTT